MRLLKILRHISVLDPFREDSSTIQGDPGVQGGVFQAKEPFDLFVPCRHEPLRYLRQNSCNGREGSSIQKAIGHSHKAILLQGHMGPPGASE